MPPIMNTSGTLADALERALGAVTVAEAERCARRLQRVTDTADPIALVACGGGKDSSFMLAFVRQVQLALRRRGAPRLHLRVVTYAHTGMTPAVFANIERVYQALRLHDDATVELLVVNGGSVVPYNSGHVLSADARGASRATVLMTGHRCGAEARPTFCNACNLGMADAFGSALGHGRPAHIVMTGDSPAEQRTYAAWIRRIARHMEVDTAADGFLGTLHRLDAIAGRYRDDIHMHIAGAPSREAVPPLRHAPVFFSVYEDTPYAAGKHWAFLTEFLGFDFDQMAFSFTETDCANPALMAHLRGLRAERTLGLPYAAGVRQYAEFAIGLMRKKAFPPQLTAAMAHRYSDDNSIMDMRRRASVYALEAYDLTEQHLVCMICSPFAGRGTNLATFLEREHPHLADDVPRFRIHLEAVAAVPGGGDVLAPLRRISGLDDAQLRGLYTAPEAAARNIDVILRNDPHKALVPALTAVASDQGPALELISGR